MTKKIINYITHYEKDNNINITIPLIFVLMTDKSYGSY